jgi:Domain of unknown function (DUF4145)
LQIATDAPNFGLEPSSLIAPSATLIAILIAIVVFTVNRMVERHRLVQDRIQKEDVPETIRERIPFRVGIYAESLIYLIMVGLALYLSWRFWDVIFHSVAYYIDKSPLPITDRVAQWSDYSRRSGLADDFDDALLQLPILLVGVGAIVAWELVPAVMPAIVRSYLNAVRGVRVGPDAAQKMLESSVKARDSGDLQSAVLLAGTAVEFLLRWFVDADPTESWTTLIGHAIERLEQAGLQGAQIQETTNQLRQLRQLRNRAAHHGSAEAFTPEEAQLAISSAKLIVDRLRTAF